MNTFKFTTTFKTQIELTPRVTLLYNKNIIGFGIEWLWFSVYYGNEIDLECDRCLSCKDTEVICSDCLTKISGY